MTKRQRQIRAFVTSYVARHGDSPTLKEIAAGCGVSTATAHEHVGKLLDAKLLNKRPGCGARNLVPAGVCPTCGHELGADG